MAKKIDSNPGESANLGFDVQRLICVSSIIDAIDEPNFQWVKSEAIQDFDVGYKDKIVLHQVKNTKVNVPIINKYFDEWKETSFKYPDKPFKFVFHTQGYPEKLNHFIKLANRYKENELPDETTEYQIATLGLVGNINEWLESFEFRLLPVKSRVLHYLRLEILDKLKALYGSENEDGFYLEKLNMLVGLLERDPPIFISATNLLSNLGLNAVPNSSIWRRKYSNNLPQLSEDLHNLGELVATEIDRGAIKPDPNNPYLFITNPNSYYQVDQIIPSLIFYEKALIPFFGNTFDSHTDKGSLKYFQSSGIFANEKDYERLNSWVDEYKVLSFLDMPSVFSLNDNIINEAERISDKLASLQFPATGTGCMCSQSLSAVEIEMDLQREIDLIKTLKKPIAAIPSSKSIKEMDEARFKDTFHQVLVTIQEFAISNLILNSNGTQYSDWKTSPILEFIHHRHMRKRKALASNYVKTHFFSSLGEVLPTFRNMNLEDVMLIRDKFADFLPPIRREISRMSRNLAQESIQDDIQIHEEMDSYMRDKLFPDIYEFKDAITRSNDTRLTSILLNVNSEKQYAGIVKTPFTKIQDSLRLLSKDHLPGYRTDYMFFLQMLNMTKK